MPTKLSPARLRAITAVAETGSFAAAGRQLELTHSAVAQQIHGFETSHGMRLFERVQGRLAPTPLCQELAEIGERALEVEADITRLIERRNPSGQLHMRIGLGNSMPGIAIIGRIIANHPSVSISIETGSHKDMLTAVLRREVDVAVLPDIPADPRFRRQVVLQQDVVAIVAGDHPLATRSEVDLQELADTALIFRSRGSSTQKVVDKAFTRVGLAPKPRLIAATRDAVYEAVSIGIGVGFMWRLGTHRADAVRRLSLKGIGKGSQEVVFSLAEDRNPLTDMVFLAATEYARQIKNV